MTYHSVYPSGDMTFQVLRSRSVFWKSGLESPQKPASMAPGFGRLYSGEKHT